MSNLIKKETQLFGYNFKESEYNIIKASTSPAIKDSEIESKSLIQTAIIAGTKRLNHKDLNDDEVEFMRNEIFRIAKSKYKNIKIQEILIAIENGTSGSYGNEVVYLSATNVLIWIDKYLKEKVVVQKLYLEQKEKDREKQIVELDNKKQSEYYLSLSDKIKKEINTYILQKEFSAVTWLYIKSMVRIGYTDFLDHLSNEEKKQMYDLKMKQYIAEERDSQIKKFQRPFKNITVKEKDVEVKDRCRIESLKIFLDNGNQLNYKEIDKLSKKYTEIFV